MLNAFIEQLMNQLGADVAAVLLYDAEHQETTSAAERGFRSSRIRRVTVRSGQSLARTVIARRKNIIFADLERTCGRYPTLERYSFKDAFKDSSIPRLIALESGSTFGLTRRRVRDE